MYFIEDLEESDPMESSNVKKLNFDVRILNGRPVRFLFSVLKNSKLIYSRDERKRIEFESRVMRVYIDMEPHHELHEK